MGSKFESRLVVVFGGGVFEGSVDLMGSERISFMCNSSLVRMVPSVPYWDRL